MYTHNGLVGLTYNGAQYRYVKNIQGDIIAILDSSNDVVAKYVYDAWGNHAVCDASGSNISSGTHIANINPFRYRGYYYDTELDLYYLNSRYYDPNTGRFINADTIDYLDPESINGLNLYAYCLNNPVMYCDPTGHAFLATLLITMAIGGAIRGSIGAVNAYMDGASNLEIFGAFAAGFVRGAAVAGAMMLGGAAGLTSIGLTVAGYSLATGTAVGVSLTMGLISGLGAYSIETATNKDMLWNSKDFFTYGTFGMAETMIAFTVGYSGGRNGLFPTVSTNAYTSQIEAGVKAVSIYGIAEFAQNKLFTSGLSWMCRSLLSYFIWR